MSRKRKLWRVSTSDGLPVSALAMESQVKAYRFIENERRNWLARRDALGAGSRCSVVTVWVDERDGRGFRLYERIDFASEVPE